MIVIGKYKINDYCIILLVLLSLSVRLYGLSKESFWIDELWHYYSTMSILNNGYPVLPSGNEYTRAIIYSYLLSPFVYLFGNSVFVLRFLSTLFGVMSVVVTYFLCKKMFDNRSAIISALIISLSPICVQWSQECRMYSMFQLLYLLSAYLFYRLCLDNNSSRRIAIALLLLFVYLLSLSIHMLSLIFIPSIFVFIIIVLSYNYFVKNRNVSIDRKYVMVMLSAFVLLFLYLGNLGYTMSNIFSMAQYVPDWAQINKDDKFYFLKKMYHYHSAIVVIFPVSAYFILKKYGERALYVVVLFIVPFILHSFVFYWKLDRYSLYFYSFLPIISAPLMSEVYEKSRYLLLNYCESCRKINSYCLNVFVFVFVFVSFTFPMLNKTSKIVKKYRWPNWKLIAESRHSEVLNNDAVVSMEPGALMYYGLGGNHFKINVFSLDNKQNDSSMVKLRDPLTGVTVLNSLADLSFLDKCENVWFFTVGELSPDNILLPDDISRYLVSRMTNDTILTDNSTSNSFGGTNGIYEYKFKCYDLVH